MVIHLSAIRAALVSSLIGIALACSSAGKVHAADSSPDEMVSGGVAVLADAARRYGDHNEGSERGLEDAVRTFLKDYTDVHYAARLIVSNYWGSATPGQRDRFTEAFNNQVTNLLVQFIPDIDFDSVNIEPFQGNIEETPHLIQITFRIGDGQTVHFALVIYENDGRWLVFDVVAEGVSYVKTYRSQFTGEAAEKGLEEMIERFEIRSGRH